VGERELVDFLKELGLISSKVVIGNGRIREIRMRNKLN